MKPKRHIHRRHLLHTIIIGKGKAKGEPFRKVYAVTGLLPITNREYTYHATKGYRSYRNHA